MVVHQRIEIARRRVRPPQHLFQRLPLAYVHHEVERLPEFLRDPRLIDHAHVSFGAKILDVVAEVDASGQNAADRDVGEAARVLVGVDLVEALDRRPVCAGVVAE